MYLSQDPIGLAGNNPTLYGYVKDVNSWVDQLGLRCHLSIKKKISDILKEFENKIKLIDPNAKIGFRGSAATGKKGPHKGNIPFDSNDFDIDVFIISDELYNSNAFGNKWWRGSRKVGMGDMVDNMENKFIKEFPGYRYDPNKPMDIRIYDSSKTEKLTNEGAVIL